MENDASNPHAFNANSLSISICSRGDTNYLKSPAWPQVHEIWGEDVQIEIDEEVVDRDGKAAALALQDIDDDVLPDQAVRVPATPGWSTDN